MINFLWHGLECAVWCGVWHQFHHWWAHKHEAHYKANVETMLTQDEIVKILEADSKFCPHGVDLFGDCHECEDQVF